MTYAGPTMKVVAGFAVSYLMYHTATTADSSWFLIATLVFLAGLGLLAEGLFSGIERAVAMGRQRTDTETTNKSQRRLE